MAFFLGGMGQKNCPGLGLGWGKGIYFVPWLIMLNYIMYRVIMIYIINSYTLNYNFYFLEDLNHLKRLYPKTIKNLELL